MFILAILNVIKLGDTYINIEYITISNLYVWLLCKLDVNYNTKTCHVFPCIKIVHIERAIDPVG